MSLGTPLGLGLALLGRARIRRGPHGILLGLDCRLPFPAPAITFGDVVLIRRDAAHVAERPELLAHEARHCTQYACWLGPVGFFPAYLLASGWSWLRTRDFAHRNAFEYRAGLEDGGYLPRS